MPPDRQPVLDGTLVSLRPMTPDDREPLYAVASDPLIWTVHPAHDRWQRPVFDAFFDAGLASGGALTIVDRATGAVIGASRYDGWDPAADAMEIGWTFLARSHWGGAYNGEVKRLMLGHLHRFCRTATFMVGADNIRSRRALERIGAVLTPDIVDRTMAGVVRRHVVYRIDRAA